MKKLLISIFILISLFNFTACSFDEFEVNLIVRNFLNTIADEKRENRADAGYYLTEVISAQLVILEAEEELLEFSRLSGLLSYWMSLEIVDINVVIRNTIKSRSEVTVTGYYFLQLATEEYLVEYSYELVENNNSWKIRSIYEVWEIL